ncbi:MAG: pitrilysin family protein [bacterium]|nr:pitrilysin family protein [bacterium]
MKKQTTRSRRHSLVCLCFLLFLHTFLFPLSTSFAFVDRGETLSRTLPNGFEVLVREEPTQKVVELQVWVGVGSRDEPEGKEGIAHLFEHMLFKGTTRRGVGEIARTVEAAGGGINAYTSMDHTVYHITIARNYFDTAMDVLADAVQNPTFDAGELKREKLVVVEEIHRGKDNPSRVFSEEMLKAAYKVHPYGRTVIGTPESVGSVSRSDMVRFHQGWYGADNMKLVVVGGVRAEHVFELANRHFGEALPGRDLPGVGRRKEVLEPARDGLRTFGITMDTEPARLAVTFPIGNLTDPETPVLDLLAAILSTGRSSRFPVRLRDEGIVHSAWAYAYTPRDPGIFVLGAASGQDRVGDALEGIISELAQLQTEMVSEEELDRARDQVVNDKLFSRETVEGLAREIGYQALTLGDVRFNDRYYSRLQSVDPGDIRAAARRVFRPDTAAVGFMTKVAGSRPGEEDIRRLLADTLKPDEVQADPERVPVYRSTLPNGIVLTVREDHSLPLVAVRAGVLGGSRYETEKNQGIFNLMAHLLTRGTEGYTAQEMARKLDGMSATLGGFSGRNSFGVTGKFLARDAGVGFSLVREVLTRAVFPRNEVELFRERIISGIRARKDDMTSFSLDLFRRTLFREHPYRFPVMGTEETVAGLTGQDISALYRAVVQPEGMVISVTGDITVAEAYRLVEDNFGNMSGEPHDPGPLPVEVRSPGVVSDRVDRRDKTQTHVILGYPGPTLKDNDLDTLEVLNAVLAGQGGRLFTRLRDEEGLAYSVFSFVAPGIDPGFIAFGIGVSPDREAEAVEGFLRQVLLLREEPASDDEIDRAGRYLVGNHMIELQTLQSRADELFFPVLYGQELEKALAFENRILSVTAEQVQAAAVRYLDPDNYTLAVVQGGERKN